MQDARSDALHPTPAHTLTEDERRQIISTANESRFADMLPARIVPMLAGEGIYLASESSFSRVLRAQGQTQHRGRAKAPHAAQLVRRAAMPRVPCTARQAGVHGDNGAAQGDYGAIHAPLTRD